MSLWYCNERHVVTGPRACCGHCERVELGSRTASAEGEATMTVSVSDPRYAPTTTVSRIDTESEPIILPPPRRQACASRDRLAWISAHGFPFVRVKLPGKTHHEWGWMAEPPWRYFDSLDEAIDAARGVTGAGVPQPPTHVCGARGFGLRPEDRCPACGLRL